MANLETLLRHKSETLLSLKSGRKPKDSGLTVLGVYAEQKVLDKLIKLCDDNSNLFSSSKTIGLARHILDNRPKGFGVIAIDISLAEQDGYEFIQYLKAKFLGDDVYVTYANSNDAKMKASLENAKKYIGGKVSIVPWQHSSETVDPAEGASASTVLPKSQSVPSLKTIHFSILKNSQYNDPAEAVPPKIQAGPSSSETVVDLSVLKKPEYNYPEDSSVSTALQMGFTRRLQQ